jgi:hypothetical protein
VDQAAQRILQFLECTQTVKAQRTWPPLFLQSISSFSNSFSYDQSICA